MLYVLEQLAALDGVLERKWGGKMMLKGVEM
jgi:hypothetical protein